MADEDREKTAFVTPFGLFHFVRMPFGLQNAGATYTRMMRHVLDGMESTENFVDDVVLFRRVESTSPGTKKSICACQSSRIDGKAIKVSLWLSWNRIPRSRDWSRQLEEDGWQNTENCQCSDTPDKEAVAILPRTRWILSEVCAKLRYNRRTSDRFDEKWNAQWNPVGRSTGKILSDVKGQFVLRTSSSIAGYGLNFRAENWCFRCRIGRYSTAGTYRWNVSGCLPEQKAVEDWSQLLRGWKRVSCRSISCQQVLSLLVRQRFRAADRSSSAHLPW